jgi:hypothetical protein
MGRLGCLGAPEGYGKGFLFEKPSYAGKHVLAVKAPKNRMFGMQTKLSLKQPFNPPRRVRETKGVRNIVRISPILHFSSVGATVW